MPVTAPVDPMPRGLVDIPKKFFPSLIAKTNELFGRLKVEIPL